MTPPSEPPASTAPPAVLAWRETQRNSLLEMRGALAPDVHRALGKAVLDQLACAFANIWTETVGLYWPGPQEVAVLGLAPSILAAGGIVALPAPPAGARPAHFRAWIPGEPLATGPAGESYPRDGPVVRPTAVLLGLVGFDGANYPLDCGPKLCTRVLAAAPCALSIGIGLELMRLKTVAPLAGERPLGAVVTEAGVFRAAPYLAAAP